MADAVVTSDDLARVVDAVGKAVGSRGIVEGGVQAAAIEEAVRPAVVANVPPNDLAGVIDAVCKGLSG